MGKHRLILLRHGKSDWSADAASDFERPLTERGRKSARRIGKWLRPQLRAPVTIVSSPAARARETAVIVADQLGVDTRTVEWTDAIYEASVEDLREVVRAHAGTPGTLLLIGHNPGLDALLCHLSGDAVPATPDGKLMTTAAAAILDFGGTGLSDTRGSGRLTVLQRPRDLS